MFVKQSSKLIFLEKWLAEVAPEVAPELLLAPKYLCLRLLSWFDVQLCNEVIV